MRILYYSAHPHLTLDTTSNDAVRMKEMVAAFKKGGHEVVVKIMGTAILKEANDEDSDDDLLHTLKSMVPSLVKSSLKDLKLLQFDNRCYSELLEVTQNFKPDFIYERGSYLMTAGVKVAKTLGIKHFLEINSPHLEEKLAFEGRTLLKKLSIKKESEQYNSTTKIVVVSSPLKEYLINKYALNEDKVIVAPNCINTANINIKEDPLIEEIKSFKKDCKLIGYVGSISSHHGVNKLINALHYLIADKKNNAKLLIVGGGENLILLKEQVLYYGISNNVYFTDNVSNDLVYSLIDLMDITVLVDGNWYGSPVKIFEYGAMGKIVVSINNGASKDILIDNENAILFNAGANNLIQALERSLSNSNPSLGTQLRKTILGNYTWDKNTSNIISIYNELKPV